MKKIMGAALVATLVVSTAVMGTGVMAASRTTSNREQNKTVQINQANGDYDSRDDYMERRRAEYEKIIDEEVQKGNLTTQEAAEYKSDFFEMAEYCGRVRRNNSRSNISGFSCH